MQLCFLGVTSAVKNHRNSNMYNSQPRVGVRLYGQSKNRRKLPQNVVQFVIRYLHNLWSWKRANCPYICSRYIKKCPYVLHILHKNFTCWKQFKFFILSGNFLLRESPFHIVNCLKVFNFTLFFVYTLKLLKGPIWHVFLLYFEKHITFSRACGSREVHQLLNKTMEKLSAKVSKRGLVTSLKKGGPQPTALLAFPNSNPALNYIQKKELASFYNTIELIKVLCNVIKVFFDHSVMSRIT